MEINKTKQIAGFAVVVAVVLGILSYFGMYVSAVDSVFGHLILKGQFFPPTDKYYIVTSDVNRFLLYPTTQLYRLWPHVNWHDTTLLISSFTTLFLVLFVVYATLLKTFGGSRSFGVAVGCTILWGIIIAERAILFDPFTGTLVLPLLVFLLPSYPTGRWATVATYALLAVLLFFCLQLRPHGIYMGLIGALVLMVLQHASLGSFVKRHKYSLLLMVVCFGVYTLALRVQDRQLTVEEERIREMDGYVYNYSDGYFYAKPDGPSFSNPVDSIRLLSYYTFFFPEPADTAIAYLEQVTYSSIITPEIFQSLPIKWDMFWEQPKAVEAVWYYNFTRLLWYMVIINTLFAIWVVLYGKSKVWYQKGFIWTVFAWGYFISIGVVLKMPYKLAAPLLLFLLLGYLLLALQIWRERKQENAEWGVLFVVSVLFGLMGIAGAQLWVYQSVKHDRQGTLQQKAAIVAEMNSLFTDKLLVFDMFSLVLLETETGIGKERPVLRPDATMIGDYYTSLMPVAKQHLEQLAGTAELDGFYQYCATNPDKVVLVMSQHRINMIKAYLELVKGVRLEFVPLEGDFKIEGLEWDFYEVPLRLNYYTVRFPTTQ